MTEVFSPDGNGIPKSVGIAAAWDIVDSGTALVRNQIRVAPKITHYFFNLKIYKKPSVIKRPSIKSPTQSTRNFGNILGNYRVWWFLILTFPVD